MFIHIPQWLTYISLHPIYALLYARHLCFFAFSCFTQSTQLIPYPMDFVLDSPDNDTAQYTETVYVTSSSSGLLRQPYEYVRLVSKLNPLREMAGKNNLSSCFLARMSFPHNSSRSLPVSLQPWRSLDAVAFWPSQSSFTSYTSTPSSTSTSLVR